MKLKSIIKLFFIIGILFLNLSVCQADNISKNTTEIKEFFQQQKVLLNESNIEELKKCYAEEYSSNDGFNKNTLFKLFEETLKNHPDIKYDIAITDLTVNEDCATVKTCNKSIATTAEKSDVTNDKGILSIDMETVFNLKKTNDHWEIVSEKTTAEKTSLFYGSCKNSAINLCAPTEIEPNTEYTVTLEVPERNAKLAMGSIKKEIITYPAQEIPDIFKSFDSIGVIERIFKSNNTGNNETVAASVAFAAPNINKNTSDLDIKITGLGILLQRINVEPSTTK